MKAVPKYHEGYPGIWYPQQMAFDASWAWGYEIPMLDSLVAETTKQNELIRSLNERIIEQNRNFTEASASTTRALDLYEQELNARLRVEAELRRQVRRERWTKRVALAIVGGEIAIRLFRL